jgi:hypothetical protein
MGLFSLTSSRLMCIQERQCMQARRQAQVSSAPSAVLPKFNITPTATQQCIYMSLPCIPGPGPAVARARPEKSKYAAAPAYHLSPTVGGLSNDECSVAKNVHPVATASSMVWSAHMYKKPQSHQFLSRQPRRPCLAWMKCQLLLGSRSSTSSCCTITQLLLASRCPQSLSCEISGG